MQFKLLLALIGDDEVDAVLKAARNAGATGATVITSARGEGLRPEKSFLGLDLVRHRNVVLLVVEEHLSREILEKIAEAGQFEAQPGSGIAVQVPIEDAIGLSAQIRELAKKVGDEI
ncbi:MAG TPA: P-II family nitrogen regulator [Alphaproteobacteria bacterium]|nr:P-II family nitrogen regulator [Alphaproteobacteria bacterium]